MFLNDSLQFALLCEPQVLYKKNGFTRFIFLEEILHGTLWVPTTQSRSVKEKEKRKERQHMLPTYVKNKKLLEKHTNDMYRK